MILIKSTNAVKDVYNKLCVQNREDSEEESEEEALSCSGDGVGTGGTRANSKNGNQFAVEIQLESRRSPGERECCCIGGLRNKYNIE